MRYQITHNPTGEMRVYEDDGDYNWEFLWEEGNYSCDCNRHLFFERAAGREPEDGECPPCGEELYSVEFVPPNQ